MGQNNTDDGLQFPARRRALGMIGAGTVGLVASGPALLFGGEALAAETGLFGRTERKIPSLGKFPKWRGALDKYFEEADLKTRPCDRSTFNMCELQEWQSFLDGLKNSGKSEAALVDAVNRKMNEKDYILDPINWNLPDYWASPGEFARKHGDCEDYGIAKFMSLRELGIAPDRMRIVVLQDRNLKVAHAVMALDVEDDILILDNQIDSVISHTRIRHYQPIYAVNENAWWLYR